MTAKAVIPIFNGTATDVGVADFDGVEPYSSAVLYVYCSASNQASGSEALSFELREIDPVSGQIAQLVTGSSLIAYVGTVYRLELPLPGVKYQFQYGPQGSPTSTTFSACLVVEAD